MSERLGRHGVAWRLGPVPVYDDDDELIDVVREPLWLWGDLTDGERDEIGAEVAEHHAHRPQDDADSVFLAVLGYYGVMCPHRWVAHEPTHRECDICHLTERLPGQTVQVAGRVMRFEGKPPPVLSVPRLVVPSVLADPSPHPSPTIEVDEYVWDGHGYRLAPR